MILNPEVTEKFKHSVDFCLKYLNIDPDRIRHLDIYSDDEIKETGRCYYYGNNDFMILIKTEKTTLTELFLTLAHEMVHVKQYLYDNLETARADRKMKNIPYRETWWEKEAYEKESKILLAYVAEIKAR